MDFDEVRLAAMQQEQAVLVTVHEMDGQYQFFNQAAFADAGVDVRLFAGRRWQEFTFGDKAIASEEARVRRASRTGEPIAVRAVRDWPGRKAILRGTLNSISTPGGVRVILRRGRIIQPQEKRRDLDAKSVEGILQECDYIDENLKMLIGVAARGEMNRLLSLLEAAIVAGREERQRLTRLALTS